MMTSVRQQLWSWKRWQVSLCAAVVLMALLPAIGLAQPHPWEQQVVEICVPLGVPKALALALIDLESKRNPLALNVAQNGSHQGFLPHDLNRAHEALDDALKQTPNVGVGLLQITYRYHQAAMAPNPHRFFDPAINLAYGCQYLAGLLSQPGPLWKRIGRYHSASNVAKQQAYASRVLKRMMRYIHQNGRN